MKTNIMYGFLKAVVKQNEEQDYTESETKLFINKTVVDIKELDIEDGDVYIEVDEKVLERLLSKEVGQ